MHGSCIICLSSSIIIRLKRWFFQLGETAHKEDIAEKNQSGKST